MTVTAYSIVSAVVIFNLALVFVYLLRRRRNFIARYGIQVLLVVVALGLLRLLSPVDGQFPHVIRSHKVIPAIRSALIYELFGSRITVGQILLAVWFVGTLIFLLRDVRMILRFKRQRSQYTQSENAQVAAIAQELGITKPVVITPCVPMPHVAGYFRQVIYVPPLELSDEDWNYVLRHEMQHILAHDQLIKLCFLFLRALFWWNPVSQLFIRELDAILELRCDHRVISKLREEEGVAYFETMLKVMKQLQPLRKATATSGLIGGASANRYNIKQRYEVFASGDKRHGKAARGAVIALICAVFAASYFVIVQPMYEPPAEDLEGGDAVILVENEESFIVFNGEKFVLFLNNGEVRMELTPDQLDDEPYCNFPIANLEEYEAGE